MPPEVIRATGGRPGSRLVIRKRQAGRREARCASCGTPIRPGDLYAAADQKSDRCIRCVDGWPLASIKGVPE
jgi:ribosomal protein S14